TGQTVAVGEPLFSIYSPELYEARKTYALARATFAAAETGQRASGTTLGGELVESARQKLLSWDMTEEQIRALEASGNVERVTPVLSRVQGVVTRREVVAGARVEPGATLYELADLSTVWIHAEIYETEIPAVRVGAEASIELESLP